MEKKILNHTTELIKAFLQFKLELTREREKKNLKCLEGRDPLAFLPFSKSFKCYVKLFCSNMI